MKYKFVCALHTSAFISLKGRQTDEIIIKMQFYNRPLNFERKVSEANLSRVPINVTIIVIT